MWDGSSGDMTLSEQLLSLREQDSLDDGGESHIATVNFHLQYRTTFGQGVKLIGSDPKLGECVRCGGGVAGGAEEQLRLRQTG